MTNQQLVEYRDLILQYNAAARLAKLAQQSMCQCPENELLIFKHRKAQIRLNKITRKLDTYIDDHIELYDCDLQDYVADSV